MTGDPNESVFEKLARLITTRQRTGDIQLPQESRRDPRLPPVFNLDETVNRFKNGIDILRQKQLIGGGK